MSGVAIMGTRFSKNGYEYSSNALDSLTHLAEGSKVFLNHPSKSEYKERDGVRDVRDFAGVFSGVKRSGDKVYGNLKVRESFWPLFKDIASMSPRGVGMSINSQAKVHKDVSGKESVVDIVRLRSCDLVASAATVDSLWESHRNIFESARGVDVQEATQRFRNIINGVGTTINTKDIEEAKSKFRGTCGIKAVKKESKEDAKDRFRRAVRG